MLKMRSDGEPVVVDANPDRRHAILFFDGD